MHISEKRIFHAILIAGIKLPQAAVLAPLVINLDGAAAAAFSAERNLRLEIALSELLRKNWFGGNRTSRERERERKNRSSSTAALEALNGRSFLPWIEFDKILAILLPIVRLESDGSSDRRKWLWDTSTDPTRYSIYVFFIFHIIAFGTRLPIYR